MNQKPMIGISASFLHTDPSRPTFIGKTLQYVQQSLVHWVMSSGGLALMVPNSADERGKGGVELAAYAERLDALVIGGGTDVWPGSYGESPLETRWSGDRMRDEYELELLHAFKAHGKPVQGICRGLQLMNVAFGGTLYQDIDIQRPGPVHHRDLALYERNSHEVEFVAGTRLAEVHAGLARARVDSVHHQGIRDLAPAFSVEARCPADGLIEAVRLPGESYLAAVQWHPEFNRPECGMLDDMPMLNDFLRAASAAKAAWTRVPKPPALVSA